MKKTILAVLAVILLASCGGGGDSGGNVTVGDESGRLIPTSGKQAKN